MEYATVIAAAAAGLLLGLRYRAPALMAATALLIVLCVAAALTEQWPLLDTVLWTLSLAVTLQTSYFAGVALAHFMRSRRQ